MYLILSAGSPMNSINLVSQCVSYLGFWPLCGLRYYEESTIGQGYFTAVRATAPCLFHSLDIKYDAALKYFVGVPIT